MEGPCLCFFLFQAEDGIRDLVRSRGLGDVYKRQQGLIGRSIFNEPTPGKREWHGRVAWGIGGLFAANTVTGAWNLIEGRKNPNGRKRRLAHGLLMMAADAGFLATALQRPDVTRPDYGSQRSRHRTLAFTSIGLATAGYAVMLFGNR